MSGFVRSSVVCLIMAGCCGAAALADDVFTIGVISDTQNYCDERKPQPTSLSVYLQQMQYIIDHRIDKNIVFASHVGDVVQHGDGTNGVAPVYGGPAEYDRARQAAEVLGAAGIPFGMAPGNHDYDNYSYTPPAHRPLSGTAMWRGYFGSGATPFAGQPWYGGASDSLAVNPGLTSYQTFTACGRTFLHIALEMEAGASALAWAQEVVDAHRGLPTIVTTHSYLNPPDDSDDNPPLVVPASRTVASYITGSPGGWSDAQGVWDNFIKVNDQIFMVLCGHTWGGTHDGVSKAQGIRIDNNDFGHPVYQILTDYQGNTIGLDGVPGSAAGGAGWMRFMEFNLTTGTIHFYTYSTLLDRYAGCDGERTFNQDPAFSDFELPIPAQLLPQWIAVDFHQHSTFTDGSYAIGDLMGFDEQFGLDWWASSEHGGGFPRDGRFYSPDVFWDSYTPSPIIGDYSASSGHQNMWRWQSIRDYSFAEVQAARGTYGKPIVQALEWNAPGHEHSSMGLIAGQFSETPSASAVAQFEYMFDNSDADTTGGAAQGWTKSTLSGHAKAVEAAAWLQANYPSESWIVPAHVERKNMWSIAAFRDLNNAAPDVAFGFESMPGHQRGADRGEYKPSSGSVGSYTYGGCGVYAAQVGGVWDALLGEGRNFWLFASSDFHALSNDFYPGEYQKTYVKVTSSGEAQTIVDGLRSGNSFVVEGDLIDALEFVIDSQAEMGQHYAVQAGQDITVTIRVHSPNANLNHIDLIAGDVTGRVDPTSPEYSNGANPSTGIVARFDARNWTVEPDGYYSMSYVAPDVTASKYFRLRGSNLGLNVANETDADGNPLSDGLMYPNTPEKAWADLWFYSNPIFVNVGHYATADLNCDGAVNVFDIDPFVLALMNPAEYEAQFSGCDATLADCNGDGVVNALDINPFVVCLTGGGCQ